MLRASPSTCRRPIHGPGSRYEARTSTRSKHYWGELHRLDLLGGSPRDGGLDVTPSQGLLVEEPEKRVPGVVELPDVFRSRRLVRAREKDPGVPKRALGFADPRPALAERANDFVDVEVGPGAGDDDPLSRSRLVVEWLAEDAGRG